MKIFIEGETYPLSQLSLYFDDYKFFNQNDDEGVINSVGFYHSFSKNSMVFMLPKVFMKNKYYTVFGIDKENLVYFFDKVSAKHEPEFMWLRHVSIYLYNSLKEFKKRNSQTLLLKPSQTFNLRSNINDKEYSFLDLILNFLEFYRKNKHQLLHKQVLLNSANIKKPKWNITVRKSLPIIQDNVPIYLDINNKKKIQNYEEELFLYFYSILSYLNTTYNLNISINNSFPVIKGDQFEKLKEKGLVRLKKIKYKYFNDTLKRMYVLCELFLIKTDKSLRGKKKDEFLAINNYNIVFEDMIDKLISNDHKSNENIISLLNNLKYNDDGKVLDHIYSYSSIFDNSQIFYIGDSKYYKSSNKAGMLSISKQFTYAKNIIQSNINDLNEEQCEIGIRYRDTDLTEGYNVTPNFFIYGYIHDVNDFDKPEIKKRGEPISSHHFKHRLFDRDTLFLHQYQINFLYVLKAYCSYNKNEINVFSDYVKSKFKKHFLIFFKNKSLCGFEFYRCILHEEEYKDLIDPNFKRLNGKCYKTQDNKLILAKHIHDDTINDLLKYFCIDDKFYESFQLP